MSTPELILYNGKITTVDSAHSRVSAVTYEALERMRLFPFDPSDALVLALAALIPMAPLLLTVIPLDQIFKLISKVLI